MTANELRTMPLIDAMETDLDHVAVNPVPLQPASTKNLNKYRTFLISPRKVITTMTSWGRDYMFSDKFNGEHFITYT